MKKLPAEVTIVEVGPRDGLQNVALFLATEKKIQLIKLLAQSGLKRIEATSFVHPRSIPQFRDAKEMIAGVATLENVELSALVPNLTGAKNAWESGVRELAFVFSITESHNKKNVNKTREESLRELQHILALTKDHPEMKVRAILATVFGCPYEGETKEEEILSYLGRLQNLGVTTVTLSDTVGYGNPKQVRTIVRSCIKHFPSLDFGVHFHNTRGLGLANVLVCLEEGIRTYDSSIGGLGGCPFVPAATGNISTEDLVFMLDGMGIRTGVNIELLFEASRFVRDNLPGVPLTSQVFQTGLPREKGERQS